MLGGTWYRIFVLAVNVKIMLSIENQTVLNETEGYQCNSEEENRRAMEGFVVGGSYAEISNYPHSVYLMVYCAGNDNYWICGSSVLNQRILLTAAHCLYGCLKNFKIKAIAGTAHVDRINIMRDVRRYIIHEKYNFNTDFCDIGLVMLSANLPLGTTIRRVIIRPSFPMNSRGTVAGWGVISESHQESNQLKQVIQIVRPRSECSHLHLRDGMMCVSSENSWEYPAMGDSGSALITKQYQQIGLVSFKAKKKARQMIVHTNVSYFMSWIKQKTISLYCRG